MSYNRIALSLLLAAVTTPVLASAQPPGGDPGFGMGRGAELRDRNPDQRLERIAQYLDLSETQATEIESIMAEQRDTRQGDLDSLRTGKDELQALLESETPDATLVGEKVIEMHALRTSLRQRNEENMEKIRGVLTPEQGEKFEAFQAARGMRGGPGERGRDGWQGQRRRPRERPEATPDPVDG